MKKILLITFALAAFAARANTNTNFVAVAKGVGVNTNGVLSAPSNFFSTNDVVIGSDVDLALSNTWGWVNSTRTIIVNTNFYTMPEAVSAFVARASFAIAATNVASFWNSTNQTLAVNTNYAEAGGLAAGVFVLATTNLSVTFGTNNLTFDHRGLVINSTTGRTANIGYMTDGGVATGTLRFVNGILASPP